jgi:RimJ/RimL family protein N-acetyltransferase
VNILGKRVVLRAVTRADLPLLHEWGNDPTIWPLLGGWHFPTSPEWGEAWLEGIRNDSLNQRLAIDTTEHGLIGTANIVDINWKDRTAFHGLMIGSKDIRGHGYGFDTIMAVMRFAFDELGLFRLDSSIIESNRPSYHVYVEKCGWREEGRQRGWYSRSGKRWDRILVGITADDYRGLIERTRYWD